MRLPHGTRPRVRSAFAFILPLSAVLAWLPGGNATPAATASLALGGGAEIASVPAQATAPSEAAGARPETVGEPLPPYEALLVAVHPPVEWSAAGSASWEAVPGWRSVRAGERVRTGPGGAAQLAYDPAAAAHLEPDTGLLVERLDRRPSGLVDVRLRQFAGLVLYRGDGRTEDDASLEIVTPTAHATVRGASLSVQVDPDGASRLQHLLDGPGVVSVRGADPAAPAQPLLPGYELALAHTPPVPAPPGPISRPPDGPLLGLLLLPPTSVAPILPPAGEPRGAWFAPLPALSPASAAAASRASVPPPIPLDAAAGPAAAPLAAASAPALTPPAQPVSPPPSGRPPIAATTAGPPSASAPSVAPQGPSLAQPQVSPAVAHDRSPPLRSLQTPPRAPAPARDVEVPSYRRPAPATPPGPPAPALDPALTAAGREPRFPMPPTIISFDGIANANNLAVLGSRPVPPDTNGDVGPNHYVQSDNLVFAVYSKAGALLLGPLAGNSIWTGFSGVCETTNRGDPIVLYDRIADRWLLSQFASTQDASSNPTGPFFECVAVSQTADPTGSYYRYAFQISATKFNDYPKLGVWPDAYYASFNQFTFPSETYAGVGVAAFERSRMLNGQSANMVYFDLASSQPNSFGLLPSHLNGPTLPATGSPNYFAEAEDTIFGFATDRLQIFQFHVDWANTSASTFTGPTVLNTMPFDMNLCAFSLSCIPQQGTPQLVDAISDRLMHRLNYRNFGTYEALVANHTVDVTGFDVAGIRWYELHKTAGAPWTIYQQGTHSPDSTDRWMGSINMDRFGNVALGYSASSASLFPAIRYAGRLAVDPLGTLPVTETTLQAGDGSQTASNRWGDYSSMSVDPADDCSFWYTQQYYPVSSDRNWFTRIGSFKFPGCGAPPTTCPPPALAQRPNVAIGVAPAEPGRLTVSVTATTSALLPTNQINALTFGTPTNAVIDVPGGPTGSPGNFTHYLSPAQTSFTFSIRRPPGGAGVGSTVPFTVQDLCQPWPTFAGGGPTAF